MHVPPITAASGGGYIDDAVDALAATNVYVSTEVGDAAALTAQLDQQIGDASIGVAVFSDNASFEASGPEIVAELARADGLRHDHRRRRATTSRRGRGCSTPGEAMRIANEAEQSADSVDDALTQTVQEVVAASGSPRRRPDPTPAGADGGVIVGPRAHRRRPRGRRHRCGARRPVRRRRRRLDQGVPDGVSAQIDDAEAARAASTPRSGHPAIRSPRRRRRRSRSLADNVDRAVRAARPAQRRRPAQHRRGRVRRQAAQAHRGAQSRLPARHPDPPPPVGRPRRARARSAARRCTGSRRSSLENIKQVNARRGLHFQVSLDGLIGGRKELQDWDRAFNDAADEGGCRLRPLTQQARPSQLRLEQVEPERREAFDRQHRDVAEPGLARVALERRRGA